MATSTKPSTLTARCNEIQCTLMVLTRFEIASKKEMHGKDQAKWFKLIFERRLGEITIDRDMTKEMLRRRKNFDHPTVESIHVHDGLSLLRRASEYKCEIVNRMTAIYASKLPIPSGKSKEEILTETLKSLWTTAEITTDPKYRDIPFFGQREGMASG